MGAFYQTTLVSHLDESFEYFAKMTNKILVKNASNFQMSYFERQCP